MTQTNKKELKKAKKEKKIKAGLENFLVPSETKEVVAVIEDEGESLKPFIPAERTSKVKATTIQGVRMSPENAKHFVVMLEESFTRMQRLYTTTGKMSAEKRRYLQDLYNKLLDARDVASIK